MWARPTRWFLCVALASALGSASAPVHAAPFPAGADLESRLERIGVSAELRKGVHAALERGGHYLRERQGQGGDFTYRANPPHSIGLTALCGLAGRHAGGRDGEKVAREAIRWLMEDPRRLRPQSLEGDVYNQSLALMLLSQAGMDREVLIPPHRSLVDGMDPGTGWWGYLVPAHGNPPRDPVRTAGFHRLPILSTTQFAVLGLWDARQRGLFDDAEVWRRHLRGMIATQSTGGSWAYSPDPQEEYLGYRCGTFMGLAGLLLATASLGGLEALPEPLRESATHARERGIRALHRDGVALLELLETTTFADPSEADFVESPFYELYALEKACIFAGVEKLGELPWYARGAAALVRRQNADGGWGGRFEEYRVRGRQGPWIARSNTVASAFAILFLSRAPDSHAVPTGAAAVVTPGEVGWDLSADSADRLSDRDLRDILRAFLGRRAGAGEKAIQRGDADRAVLLGPRVLLWLVEELEGPDPARRDAAGHLLALLLPGEPGYAPGGSDAERAARIALWEQRVLGAKKGWRRNTAEGRFDPAP